MLTRPDTKALSPPGVTHSCGADRHESTAAEMRVTLHYLRGKAHSRQGGCFQGISSRPLACPCRAPVEGTGGVPGTVTADEAEGRDGDPPRSEGVGVP